MKLLNLLSIAQLGKFYSQYGMRALLVLYMIQSLKFTDSRSYGINAVFCGLFELGGILGGIAADRYLGLRRALLIGTALLAAGYGCLVLENGLFLALGLIILGGSLFSGNIMGLLGTAYSENDPQRKKGFTFFYMMQNLGALVSTLLCAVIAEKYGYRAGFGLAAAGMAVAGVILFLRRADLPDSEVKPRKEHWALFFPLLIGGVVAAGFCMDKEASVLPFLPIVTGVFFLFFAVKLFRDTGIPQVNVRKLLVYLAALMLFFAAEDQICSSLIVFAERETDRMLWGWTVPSAILMSINPVAIVLGGALIGKLRIPLLVPFFLLAASFGALALLCALEIQLSILAVLGIVVLVSLAELMVGPVVYSVASEVAGNGREGRVMGMIPLAFSISFLLSGEMSKMVVVPENAASMTVYASGFGKIAWITLTGGVALHWMLKRWARDKIKVAA